MRNPLTLRAAAVAAALLAAPALAATDDECTAMWKQADTNGDGAVSADESARYSAAMRVADKTAPANDAWDEATFLENCKAGVFTTAAMDEGAPLSGANSFTEGQAQDRAMAAGFTNVSALKQDDNGIWRGTAMQGGKNVNVAIDYKGNVVAQ